MRRAFLLSNGVKLVICSIGLVCISLSVVLVIASIACGESPSYATGRAFQRQLELPASVMWSEVPLRNAFESLASARRLAVWIDRRLDPNLELTFGLNADSLQECLETLTIRSDALDVAWIKDVVYVAPPDSANRLSTVHVVHARQLAKLPDTSRNVWENRQPMSWPKLTTPYELLDAIEAEVGSVIAGREQVLHDLWGAGSFPALPAYVRLELLLAGFDLTFVWTETGTVKVVSLPTAPQFEARYRISGRQREDVKLILAQEDGASISNGPQGMFLVRGSWRTHQRVERALIDPSRKKPKAQLRYTLRAEQQPVGPFLEQLCSQLGLTCEFSDAARKHYDKRISFWVQEVDEAKLLAEVVAAAELVSNRDGGVIRVDVAPQP